MATNAFLDKFANPDSEAATRNQNKIDYYNQAWAYYRSTMFSRSAQAGDYWASYLSQRELYKKIRLIYNPVPEIVDFYVDNVWQANTNSKYPSLVVPVTDETKENLIAAVAQIDQWTNWGSEQEKVKKYAATTGGVLIEGHRDFDRQKITQKAIWGSYVSELKLNDANDALGYTLEYSAYDAVEKKTYRYKKIVSKLETRYFRDDKPYAPPGREAVEPNPLGFCFAVWLSHSTDGTAAVLNYDKVDEANSLASHLHDNIHKEIESGKVISGIENFETDIRVLTGASQNKDGTINENDPRTDRLIIAAKGQANIGDLSGLLKLAEAEPYLKNLLLSFGNDYPELEYRQIIKQSAQLSGIALERLLTPAQNRLDRAAANYNRQLIKLRQMQIAAAGYALKNEWSNPSDQQKIFASFDLDSYEGGELDFNIKRSLLIELSEEELIDLEAKRIANANAAEGLYTLKTRLIKSGMSEDEAEVEMKQLAKESPVIAQAYGMKDEEDLGVEE